MSRRLAALATASAWALLCLCVPVAAPAAPAPLVARPDPVLVSVHLDYVGPLRGPSGTPVALPALDPAVAAQAVADERYLHYRAPGDLGGFLLAPVGVSAMSSGGRDVVGAAARVSQIPQYAQAAEGVVRSFAFLGSAPGRAPQNGRTSVPGIGLPPRLPPPSNSNAVPPPNQGFGGRPVNQPSEGGKQPSGGKRPSKSKHPSSGGKHPPATTPTPTPVVIPSPASAGGGEEAGGASCGTVGLAITSDHSTCRIYAVNMAPGQSASEVMTVRDEAGVPVTLSLRASGEESRFWSDLRMGVWQAGTAAPDPLPALEWWTTQDNQLATLQPGQSVRYEIELYLPTSAGNEDQGQTALIDLTWRAQQ